MGAVGAVGEDTDVGVPGRVRTRGRRAAICDDVRRKTTEIWADKCRTSQRRHWDWLWDILGVAGGQQPLQLATAGLGHGDRDGDCTRRTSRHTPPGGASDTGALAQIADARFALRFRRRELPFCVGVAGCGAGSVAGAPRLICLFFQAAYAHPDGNEHQPRTDARCDLARG